MTRPDGFAFMLDFLGAPDAQVVEAYILALEAEFAACQAREAYLREVLEAQPRRMAWVRLEGVDQELPDYATRLRDQALAGHQP